jgi:hypothetical protein
MWSNKDSLGSWGMSNSINTSWTTNIQAEENGDEIETIQDESTTVASAGTDQDGRPAVYANVSPTKGNDATDDQGLNMASSSCDLVDGTWVCHPYKIELLERQLFSNNTGSSRRAAIIETLRYRK